MTDRLERLERFETVELAMLAGAASLPVSVRDEHGRLLGAVARVRLLRAFLPGGAGEDLPIPSREAFDLMFASEIAAAYGR